MDPIMPDAGSGGGVERERAARPTLGIQSMAIVDGHGGVLTVDLGSPDAPALRDACHLLLPARRAGWAGAIKVRVGERTYLLRKRRCEDGAGNIDISDLYDPSQRVSLTGDLIRMVIGVLDGVAGAAGAAGATARG